MKNAALWVSGVALWWTAACSTPHEDVRVLSARVPLHLNDHLQDATIVASDLPVEPPAAVEWKFGKGGLRWTSFGLPDKGEEFPKTPVETVDTEDAVSLILKAKNRDTLWRPYSGMIRADLLGWNREDWSHVIVQARAVQPGRMSLVFGSGGEFLKSAGSVLISDGRVHSYRMPIRWEHLADAKWEQIGFVVESKNPGKFDIVSAKAVPKTALYAEAAVGVSRERIVGTPGNWTEGGVTRSAIYMYAPGRVEYRVRIGEGGRLDFGLGVLKHDAPVRFRVAASADGKLETVFDEEYADATQWVQRSVDLSRWSGSVIDLVLENDSPQPGDIALWLTPTLSSSTSQNSPNVIFYVIDGAGADWMSLYGYNRRTTPNLERLAAEGAVFDHAYSNATWTKLSTASYMTSLYYSVLGGHRTHSDRIPDNAVTMAEQFSRAGYQTAVFTSNPYAATMSGLERGVGTVRVIDAKVNSTSSKQLHEMYWRWREEYPGQPYWVHFQTTDVHEMFDPRAPFAGLYVSPEERAAYKTWDKAVEDAGGYSDRDAYERAGVNIESHALFQQGLYDECMAQQDFELGRLVARLKDTGEWENTILIVASDHGYPAGGHRLMEPMEDAAPFIHPFATRIPLAMFWPGHIEGGQRFDDPVSMIDVLPTLLDLIGAPEPEILQGRSLKPLLFQKGKWEPRPVFVDMFAMDFDTGQLIGSIEVIDGRWGASLSITSGSRDEAPPNRGTHGDGLQSHYTRQEPLVVYDLWADPFLQQPINTSRPDLVERYERMLTEEYEQNRALALHFQRGGQVDLTREELERLKALGYIE
jgi:arylsulfatase A-like enzyme